MRSLNTFALSLLALSVTACTCRPHRQADMGATPTGTQIDTGAEEGPLKNIHFAFDSYALSSTSRQILQNNAEWLKANPGSRVQIQGHCDERGTNEYNMVLGLNRANSARDYLRSLGITDNRMSTVSYGEELPADPASNEEAWAKNRRDVFKVEQ